jgi:hypothetical protein
MPWIACALALIGGGADCQPNALSSQACSCSPPHVAIEGDRSTARSANFQVVSRHSSHDAREIARYCEAWRAHLQGRWCDESDVAWSPRCHVVIHASQSHYLAAAGCGAAQTFGSSWIEHGSDRRVSRRQIDFRGDSPHGIASVPHEMTHVVLADLLGGRQPPRWADEGLAILADSEPKQRLHERDLTDGLTRQTAFRAVELLTLDAYPHPSRVPAFYGQSASLTAFLVARGEPTDFIAFLQSALDRGYDTALRDCYDIVNVTELERLWHQDRLAAQSGDRSGQLAATRRKSVEAIAGQ